MGFISLFIKQSCNYSLSLFIKIIRNDCLKKKNPEEEKSLLIHHLQDFLCSSHASKL